jgi:hypothetical protein
MNRSLSRALISGLTLIAYVVGSANSVLAVNVAYQSTSSTSNFSDAGSNLGNFGYWFANFNRTGGVNDAAPTENAIDAKPAYVSIAFGSGVDSAGGWGNYADLTLPNGTVGNSGALEINNPGAPDRTAGSQHEYMTLTFGAGSPNSLSLGVVADNSDGLQFSNSAILVNNVSTGPLTNNLMTDVHTFRLTNIVPGDTVRIDGRVSTANTVAHLGGFLIDQIPEPTTAILLVMLWMCSSPRRLVARPRRV